MTCVLVAMSGGVDSSLTAALLHEQGYQVVGVTMRLWQADTPEDEAGFAESVTGAQQVCKRFNIPHTVVDCREQFHEHVIGYFIAAYAHGETPNPCIACNRHLKFGFLFEHMLSMDCEMLATGHYAQVVSPAPYPPDAPAPYALIRGVDYARDQSYVLAMLQQRHLTHLTFPLGSLTKQQVREQAKQRGLVTAHRTESQDICFVQGGDYRHYLASVAPHIFVPGPIVDQEGRELGQHSGLPRYTVGQRKGLGIASPQRLFVTGMDSSRNALIVGDATAAERQHFTIVQTTCISGDWHASHFRCLVQVRAHAKPAPATATVLDGQQMQIELDSPQQAITPGQLAVLYDPLHATMVLGGGFITGYY
jgi:tRNA-specific 2-thiouridylase